MNYLLSIIIVYLFCFPAYAFPPGFIAAVTSGVSASAGFCDGSDTFCTSWETGSGVLNTGATGFESTWSTADGFSKVTTSPKDGTYCVQGFADDVLVSTNGGAGYGTSATAEGWFRLDAENASESYIVIFSDTTDYYGVFMLVRDSDSNTSNGTAPVKIMGKLTSSTLEQVGTVTNVNIGEWYRYVMLYDTNNNIARVDIYNSSSVSVFSTGDVSATINFTIDSIGIYASGYGNISHDAFKANSL